MKKWVVNHKMIVKALLFVAIAYFPIFLHLDTLVIREWDEARLAINAYEMNKDGDLIVTHYEGKPDMWNTKPPLMIWLQVIFIKMMGIGELAIRLPSAIAAFLTCILIMILSLKFLKNYWLGLLSVIVLVTSNGYINVHVTRTGDYDALLTFFTTFYILCFFVFVEISDIKKKQNFMYLFFLGLTLAVLTKGIAGLLFIPGLFIYVIIRKQLLSILKNKAFYIGILGFFTVVLGYYFTREYYNPGYLKAVYENELGGRYMNTIENHKADFGFYYSNFINFQLSKWYLLLPCGIVTGFFIKNELQKNLSRYLTLLALLYFLVISISQTKLEWYDAPLYPFFAVLVGIFLYWIFNTLHQGSWHENLNYKVIPYLVIFLICVEPYRTIIDKVYKPKEYSWDKETYQIGYYLKDAVNGNKKLDGYYLLDNSYYAEALFYLNILNDMDQHIHFKDWKNLNNSDLVIAHQYEVKKYVEENYNSELIEEKENIKIYKIKNSLTN